MRSVACPRCSEIIPDDVDYCPFCGESTAVTAESLMTDDDIAVAERMAAIRASNTSGDAAAPTGPALPPIIGAQPTCMMCHLALPTHGDYCEPCHDKLELGPEQWIHVKQDATKRNMTVFAVAVIAVLILSMVIFGSLHHHHQGADGFPSSAPQVAHAS